jgi:hypothetical protein
MKAKRQLLPVDELLPAAQSTSTQATTVLGHINAVWPWIAQMGYGGRAGFYSYLDGCPGAEPEPSVAAGPLPIAGTFWGLMGRVVAGRQPFPKDRAG